MVRTRQVVAVAAMIVLTAVGCAGPGEPGGTPTGSPAGSPVRPSGSGPTESPAPAAADDTPETLAFRAPTVGGGEFDGATVAGDPVAFWFWAAWCSRCAAAAADVAAVQAEFDGRARVIGVAGLGSGDAGMERFVDRHGLDGFVHIADDEGQVWRRFGVTSQEYFVILDSAGEVVHQGPLSAPALRDQLSALSG